MNFKDFELQITELQKRAVEDIEGSFIEYVKNDILDCGKVEYLIGDEDRSLYWQDVSLECKSLIDKLIHFRENLDEDGFNTLMNQCIEIKIIADRNIIEIEEDNLDQVLFDMGLMKPKDRHLNYIHLLGSEDHKKTVIEILFNGLHRSGLIDPDSDKFEFLFKPTDYEIQKIQWHGTEKQIVGMFSLLIQEKIIPPSYRLNYLKFIELHFSNKKKEPFKSEQLTVVRSNLGNDKIEIISKIIKDLVKIKLN